MTIIFTSFSCPVSDAISDITVLMVAMTAWAMLINDPSGSNILGNLSSFILSFFLSFCSFFFLFSSNTSFCRAIECLKPEQNKIANDFVLRVSGAYCGQEGHFNVFAQSSENVEVVSCHYPWFKVLYRESKCSVCQRKEMNWGRWWVERWMWKWKNPVHIV